MKNTQVGKDFEVANAQKASNKAIWSTVAREWDCRVNLTKKTEGDEQPCLMEAELELEHLVGKVKDLVEEGAFSYVLVSGIEKGDNQNHGDYNLLHVHLAMRFKNARSGASIISKLSLTKFIHDANRTTRNFYLKSRDQSLPWSGWLDHHKKSATKVNPDKLVTYEFGEPPKHVIRALSRKDDVLPKGASQDEKIREVIKMYKKGEFAEALELYPSIVLRHHGPLAARIIAERMEYQQFDHSECLWIFGPPGTGKSAYVQMKFPGIYNKSVAKNEISYWGGFNPLQHTHFLIEDMGHETFKNIGIDQLKQWADPSQGITMAIKYLPPLFGIRCKMVVTSNFQINQLLQAHPGIEDDKAALYRRFKEVHIDHVLREDHIQLVSKSTLNMLKKAGNRDYNLCFEPTDTAYHEMMLAFEEKRKRKYEVVDLTEEKELDEEHRDYCEEKKIKTE